jgi:hypothetical protein
MAKLLFVAMLVAALAPWADAGELPVLQQPMKRGPTITLPYVPGIVLYRPTGGVFFVASQNDGSRDTATISAYNSQDASKLFQFYVLHTIAAMGFSNDGNWLYLVGGNNGEGYASRVRLSDMIAGSSPPVTTVKMTRLPVQPAVAVGVGRTLYVSDATSKHIISILSSAFDNGETSQDIDAANPQTQFFSWGRGIHALAISEAVNLAFVSYETIPKISALRRSNGATQVVDEFVRSGGKGSLYSDRPIPLALLLTTGIKTQGGTPTASLLIGDHPSLMLTVVDFDPLFRTMDIVARAPIGIRLDPKSVLLVDPVTQLVKQPIMIASDDKEHTILVGDAYSTQLVQFTRGAGGVTLERVGEIELPGAPSSVSVAGAGGSAVVAIANSHDLQILLPTSPIADAPDAGVRELQRDLVALGLNVGPIDGVPGQGTITALDVFNRATGNNVSVRNINDALKAIEDVRDKCGSSQPRCLLNGNPK